MLNTKLNKGKRSINLHFEFGEWGEGGSIKKLVLQKMLPVKSQIASFNLILSDWAKA